MYLLDAIFEDAVDKNRKDLKMHIVYAGLTYYNRSAMDSSGPIALGVLYYVMQRYGLQSLLVTMLSMERVNLVTKEVMKEYYKGNRVENKEFDKVRYSNLYAKSMNDELDEFFEATKAETYFDLDVNNPGATFFLPKITEKELRYVLRNSQGDSNA